MKSSSIIFNFIYFLLIFSLIYNLYIRKSNIFNSITILKKIIIDWNSKPIDSVQQSKYKSCNEIKENNMIDYIWEGNKKGCLLNNKLIFNFENMSQMEFKDCLKIEHSNQVFLTKWKGFNICGSSIKSKAYFNLEKSSIKDCFPKYKNCGIVDSLGNYLCIPITEVCPVNKINIKNASGENFSLEVQNSLSNEGNIIIGLEIVSQNQDKECIYYKSNYIQRDLLDNNDYIKNDFNTDDEKNKDSKEILYNICKYNSVRKNNGYGYNSLDNIKISDFFKYNNLDIYKYIEIKTEDKLYLVSKKYKGWKKECESKEFYNFIKSDFISDFHLLYKRINAFNDLIFISFLLLVFMNFLLFVLHLLKFDNKKLHFGIYILLIGVYSFTIYYSFLISNLIYSHHYINHFFEFIGNVNNSIKCSDPMTSYVIEFIAKDFSSLHDKYFNIKFLSGILILISIKRLFNRQDSEKGRRLKIDMRNKYA